MTEKFHCPEWERGTCNCPGGTVRPECPGLAALKAPPRADDDAFPIPHRGMTIGWAGVAFIVLYSGLIIWGAVCAALYVL
jgi:hypothetical protein